MRRRQRIRIGQEALAQKIGDAGIAGEARQRPGQPLGDWHPRSTPARSVCGPGSLSGKSKGSIGTSSSTSWPACARLRHPMLHIAGIGREGQRHAGRQAVQRRCRRLGAEAQAATSRWRCGICPGGGRGIGGHGLAAVIGDARQGALRAVFDQGGIGDQGVAGKDRFVDRDRRRGWCWQLGLSAGICLGGGGADRSSDNARAGAPCPEP